MNTPRQTPGHQTNWLVFLLFALATLLISCGKALVEDSFVEEILEPTPTTSVSTVNRTATTDIDEVSATVESLCGANQQERRFLALGDSYTIGQGVGYAERWPVQLVALLRSEGVEIGEPLFVARSGWTTANLLAALENAPPDGLYDLVALLIGANDQFRSQNPDQYRRELAVLLQRAINFAGLQPGRVVVLSIPDWSVTPVAAFYDRAQIAAEIDQFNAISRQETERVGALYVDIAPISHQAADDLSLLAADWLHPSGRMYALWAEAALPAACQALAN